MSEELEEVAPVEEEPKEEVEAVETETEPEGKEGKKAKKAKKKWSRKRKLVTLGVIVVILVAGGAGFTVFHDMPAFCDMFCHKSMDGYRPTYEATPGEQGTDKWGNEVEDSRAMLSAAHREYADLVCVDCHHASTLEQTVEGIEFVTGDYDAPLHERSLADVMYYRGSNVLQFFSYSGTTYDDTEFCLNDDCHRMTVEDLIAATSGYPTNPHQWAEDNGASCTDCHKAHRASIMACPGNDDYLPSGWLTTEEAAELENTLPAYQRES